MRSKRAFYNIITNLILQLATVIYGFVVPKIIIDHFGSDVNGLIASITQFLAYITLLESGFGPVVKAILYKPIAEKDTKTIADIIKTSEKFFRRIACIFVLYIMVLCAIFPFIAGSNFDMLFTILLVIIIGISTFAEYFFGMAYRLFLQADQKMYVFSIIQTVAYILCIVAVVVLALMNVDVLIIKLAAGLIFIMRPIVQNIYVKKKYKLNLKDANSNYPIKQKWDGLSQHIASVIHNNTDIVVLTVFTTLSEVSVYSVYYLVLAGVKKIVLVFYEGIDALFGSMIVKKEDDNLKKKFSSYELCYMLIIVVLFAASILLITPFIQVYTKGVTDADYIRPIFGYLLVLSEFIWAIRLPYNSLVLAAGHFKQTRRGAWVETIVNVLISVILVFRFGLIGVAIGTIVAMLVRTVELIVYANKKILKRSVWESAGKIFVGVLIIAMTILIACLIQIPILKGYLDWAVIAIIVTLSIFVVTSVTFSAIYRNDIRKIFARIIRIIKRGEKHA